MSGPSQGPCLDKTPKPDNEDFFLYVTNEDLHIARDPSLNLGTRDDPDVNILRAISRAKDWIAPYTTKNDGSLLTINIRVLRGTHYVLHEPIDYIKDNVDFHSANYHLIITPNYCESDLFLNYTT